MKKKLSILIVLSLILFIGCKEDKVAEQQELVVDKVVNVVKVSLTTTVKKDDNFQLFFKEEDNVEVPFEEQYAVWKEVKGSEQSQVIEFVLPENVLPNYLRLDVGTNPENQSITVSNLKIEYLGKKIDINSTAFFDNYFINNPFVIVEDKATGLIKTKKENNIYDPFFNSGENLKYELQNIFK
jgi:hypothetical protein